MKSQWEYFTKHDQGERVQQWLREITASGRTVDHGPFESFGEAKAFKAQCEGDDARG